MTSATDELRKSLDFMRIWISEDAHLGESAISRELEKAEGLRKLDAIEQAIAATLSRAKAKSHPYGYEPDTGAFDATRCECGCINDISATYCNGCGGEIEIDEHAEKEIYHTPAHIVFAEKHDDGSLEFAGKRYIAATLESAGVDDALALLDEMNEQQRIEYADYSQLNDAIAMLGSGTLTAEQVREAIEEAKNELLESCEYVGDMYQRQSDVLRAFGKMEQAIADELNARADLESEPPYDELLRCLENDWHIHASWDGLRRFWCIELTEEGVRLRDEWNARAERTCKPQGEWERTSQTQEIRHIYCECGEYIGEDRRESFPFAIEAKADLPNYCPNCGAKVIGGDE